MRNIFGIEVLYFLLCIVVLSCKDENLKDKNKKKSFKKEILSSEKIKEELNKNTWSILKMEYFNLNGFKLSHLHKNDTFLVKIEYCSKIYPKLNENYNIVVNNPSSNFTIKKTNQLNTFRIITSIDTDTLYYSLSLTSNVFLFDYKPKSKNTISFGQIIEVLE